MHNDAPDQAAALAELHAQFGPDIDAWIDPQTGDVHALVLVDVDMWSHASSTDAKHRARGQGRRRGRQAY